MSIDSHLHYVIANLELAVLACDFVPTNLGSSAASEVAAVIVPVLGAGQFPMVVLHVPFSETTTAESLFPFPSKFGNFLLASTTSAASSTNADDLLEDVE